MFQLAGWPVRIFNNAVSEQTFAAPADRQVQILNNEDVFSFQI